MAVIAPQTDVYLLKVPLEIDNTNQLTFANATAQFNYFNSLPKITYDNFTYQRKDNTLRIPALMDDIIQYNYVMYRNEGFSNKWFYAYIDKMEYLNDNVTAVSITTDVWQTWQFDLTYKRTFVEREHVNDDTVGLHTVPESLELGEYEIVDLRNSPLFERPTGETYDAWIPCFCVTKLPASTTNLTADGRVARDNGYIGGVFSSLKFFVTRTLTAASYVIKAYEDASDVTSDAIVNIFMVPRCCADIIGVGTISNLNGYDLHPLYNYYVSDTYTLQQPSKLAENYTPVNKKLLTYPYSYFYVTNKNGEQVEYHYEDFPFQNVGGNTARTMNYVKSIVPSSGLSAKLYFTNYKSYNESSDYGTKMYNYGINYAKVPVCAWTTDYYTNWLTQNGVNVAVDATAGILSGLLSAGTGAASGNAVGAASGLLSVGQTIGNTIGEIHKAQTTPPQAHGDINTGDFNFCFTRNSISFYEMSIRPEYARIIDSYFSAYGYKVNTVKIPNITGRRNWNYVKTVGCYIEADIPQDDLQSIKDMFNNGVTFWHNANTFADYSQNNDII